MQAEIRRGYLPFQETEMIICGLVLCLPLEAECMHEVESLTLRPGHLRLNPGLGQLICIVSLPVIWVHSLLDLFRDVHHLDCLWRLTPGTL